MAPPTITQQIADRIVQLLKLDGEVDEYELTDTAHVYHLENGEHLRIGITAVGGRDGGQFPGSAVLVNDDGDLIPGLWSWQIRDAVVLYYVGDTLACQVDLSTMEGTL